MPATVHIHVSDEAAWQESEHKRDKSGKFAKSKEAGLKNLTTNKPITKIAGKAGYQPHPTKPLHWIHPSGGAISANAGGNWESGVPGKKYKFGKGAKALAALLAGRVATIPTMPPSINSVAGKSEKKELYFSKGEEKEQGIQYTYAGKFEGYESVKANLSTESDKWLLVGISKSGSISHIAEGSGQSSLNSAFEQLHPRGEKGQFAAKTGEPDHPDKKITGVLAAVGAQLKEKDGDGNLEYDLPNGSSVTFYATSGNQQFDIWDKNGTYIPGGTGKGYDELAEVLVNKANTLPIIKPVITKNPANPKQLMMNVYGAGLQGDDGNYGKYVFQNGIVATISNSTASNGFYSWDLQNKNGLMIQSGSGIAGLEKALAGQGVKPQTPSTKIEETPEKPAVTKPVVQVTSLKQIGPQLGSNAGGQYEDPVSGQKYYVKITKSPEHARNENLAASLYQLAGAGTLQYRKSDGANDVVTEMENLQINNVSGLSPSQRIKAQGDFAVHAWLANWDAVGMTGDNIGVANGKVVNLDLGGSLAYRAKGDPKGSKFGYEAGEWNSLRNSSTNPQSAALFGSMTPQQLKESADKLNNITTVKIEKAVADAGYTGDAAVDITAKLMKRREDIKKRALAEINKPAAPPKPPPFVAPFSYLSETSGPDIHSLNHSAPEFKSGEKGSVQSYSGGGYTSINRALRYGFHSGSHSTSHDVEKITKYLDKASLPEDVIATRRVSNDYAEFLTEVAQVGSVFTDLGFISTSRTGAWSGNVTMMMRLPKGTKAASIQHISNHPGENEILVQRGSNIRVLDYDSKTKTIYCEVDQSHLVKVETL